MAVNKDNYCVIMGGGIGSRFWPFSRKTLPKQFLDFFGTGVLVADFGLSAGRLYPNSFLISLARGVLCFSKRSIALKRLCRWKIFLSLPTTCMRN